MTIPGGAKDTTFNVVPFDDTEVEGNETVTASINSSPTYIVIGQGGGQDFVLRTAARTDNPSAQAVVNIVDNDVVATNAPVTGVTVTKDGAQVNNGVLNTIHVGTDEVGGDPLSTVFTLDNNSGSDKTVNHIDFKETTGSQQSTLSLKNWMRQVNWLALIGISNARAVGAGDFTVATATPFTINNNSSQTFTINFNANAPGLRDGIVVITFSDGSNFTFTITGNGTVAVLNGNTHDIPVFSPFSLLFLLLGLFGLGKYFRKKSKLN